MLATNYAQSLDTSNKWELLQMQVPFLMSEVPLRDGFLCARYPCGTVSYVRGTPAGRFLMCEVPLQCNAFEVLATNYAQSLDTSNKWELLQMQVPAYPVIHYRALGIVAVGPKA